MNFGRAEKVKVTFVMRPRGNNNKHVIVMKWLQFGSLQASKLIG